MDDKLGSKSMKPSYFCLMLVLNPQILCQNRTLKIYTFCSRFLFVDNKIKSDHSIYVYSLQFNDGNFKPFGI